MDKKWSRENVKLSKHLRDDLIGHHYRHALKDIAQMEKRLHGISKEIKSGKAKRE